MAVLSRATLKAFFETGDKPTQEQYADLVDSLLNLLDDKLKLGLRVHSTTRAYEAGECTVYEGLIYTASVDTQGAFDPAKWVYTGIAVTYDGFPDYDNGTTYDNVTNNKVTYNFRLFKCIVPTIQGVPPLNMDGTVNANWQEVSANSGLFGKVWEAGVYLNKDVVRYNDVLWELQEADGFESTDIGVEIAANQWTAIGTYWGRIQGSITAQTDLVNYIAAQIAALVDSSPAALDTLNELAAALGDDPNFATTVTNAIAAKLSITDFVSANQIYAVATGTDTYAATFIPAIGALVAGMRVYVRFANVNTGAATLNANGLGATAIKRADGTDVQAGDLQGVVLLSYHSTYWQMVGAAPSKLYVVLNFQQLETFVFTQDVNYKITSVVAQGGVTASIKLHGTSTDYVLNATVNAFDKLDISVDVVGAITIYYTRL